MSSTSGHHFAHPTNKFWVLLLSVVFPSEADCRKRSISLVGFARDFSSWKV